MSSQQELLGTKFRKESQGALRESWETLHWEPEIMTSAGKAVGVLIENAHNGLGNVYLSSSGKILRTVMERTSEIDVSEYLSFAPKAEKLVKALRDSQWQEVLGSAEGKDILLRPGHTLFGIWYSHYESPYKIARPIVVRAKKDGLYCPEHPDKQLVGTLIPGQGSRRHYSECPLETCNFYIYNGT